MFLRRGGSGLTDTHDRQADLKLKISPPRFTREPLTREQLLLSSTRLTGIPSILVNAPAGYGKTSLLAQWRSENLAVGNVVAWYCSGAQDSPAHLLQGLVMSYRNAALRPTFGHTILQTRNTGEIEDFATLLAEIANAAVETVLIIDDADKLPPDSRNVLSYILHNLPRNLRVFIGLRSLDGFLCEDLAAYGQCEVIEVSALAFSLEETFQLFRGRFGDNLDTDGVAQLHQQSLGWPLGVQLALSAQARASTPLPANYLRPASEGKLHEHFVSLLFARLSDTDVAFLVSISIFEDFTPTLCAAVTGEAETEARLDHIIRTTPVIQLSEQGDWMRLHALAIGELQHRFEQRPQAQRQVLHEKAAIWLDAHGMTYKAVRHAFAAGKANWALDLAERSLYHTMMTQGGGSPLQGWAGVLPDSELAKRPRLFLAEAWNLALSDRHLQASEVVARIRASGKADKSLSCECDLILGGAAAFADDPDLFARLHDPWAMNPPLENPLLLKIHANRFAYKALLDGEPALARVRQQRAPVAATGQHNDYLARWGDFIIGLSYLWEGQTRLAERIVRPALLQSEADLGRRDSFSTMLAAVLATAVWENDQPDEAQLLMADRLDVLERKGLPEALMLGYRTLARVARSRNDETRALELLGALGAIGTLRGLPRLSIISLCEQIRMHAQSYRKQTCQELLARLDATLNGPDIPQGPLWRRSIGIQVELARGLAAVAARDWQAARAPLEHAQVQARAMKQGRLVVEATGLLALVLRECGQDAQSMVHEAIDLAEIFGLRRVFADAHPDLANWVRSLGRVAVPMPVSDRSQRTDAARDDQTPTTRSNTLTPREWDVLDHLERGLSNKEIARSLDVHDETVKWHVKNLFAKLDAGSRKQVVSRAHLMGLLP